MLSRTSNTLFTSLPVIRITCSDDKGTLESLLDKDDTAMKAIIKGYNVGAIQTSGLRLSGKQIILWLHDLTKFNIQINLPEGITCPTINEEFVLVKCAMLSVLKRLLAADCIHKNNIFLQVRPRGQMGGPFAIMLLNPDEGFSAPMFCRTGIVTHTNVYLDEGYMVISLAKELGMEKMNAIAGFMGTLFPEYNPAALESNNSLKRLT
jgi:hypothetical protein